MNSLSLNRLTAVLSWFGVFVAGVLSYSHFAKAIVPCGGTLSCTIVQAHPSSMLFGKIPVAYVGLVGYILFAALAMVRGLSAPKNWRKLLTVGFVATILGTAFSLWLTYVSLTQIKLTCSWCLASAGTMIVMLLVHAFMLTRPDPEAAAPKTDWLVTGVSVLAAIGLLGFRIRDLQFRADQALAGITFDVVKFEDIVPATAKRKGNPNAKVTVVEFADILCPTCREFYPEVKKLVAQYGDGIQFGYRNVPLYTLEGHETAIQAGILSELAAEKGRFWQYLDLAYDPGNTARVKSVDGLLAIAVEAGLDGDEADKALRAAADEKQESKLLDRVNEDFSLAVQSMRIMTTPTFVILAEGIPPKAVTPARLRATLESEPYIDLIKNP